MAIVYKGRVFSLEVENARFPNGTEHEVATVRHVPCVVLDHDASAFRANELLGEIGAVLKQVQRALRQLARCGALVLGLVQPDLDQLVRGERRVDRLDDRRRDPGASDLHDGLEPVRAAAQLLALCPGELWGVRLVGLRLVLHERSSS